MPFAHASRSTFRAAAVLTNIASENDLAAPVGQFERRLKIAKFNLLRAVSLAHSNSVRDAWEMVR